MTNFIIVMCLGVLYSFLCRKLEIERIYVPPKCPLTFTELIALYARKLNSLKRQRFSAVKIHMW
jgi:hypothetical protein